MYPILKISRIRRTLVLLIALALTPLPSRAEAGDASACQRTVIAPGTLQWVSSVAFSQEFDRLLVVDPRQGKVHAFGASGNYLDILQVPFTKPGERNRATSVHGGTGGILLKLAQPEAILLGGEVQRSRRISLSLDKEDQGAAVGSIYAATVFADAVVGYGSTRRGPTDLEDPRSFSLGFFRVPLASMPFGAQQVLPFNDNKYYLAGYQYVTSNQQAAFFVKMADPAEVYRVEQDGAAQLLQDAIPEEFREVGALQVPTSGPETAELFYEELASRSIPAGLYGHGDQLFLLTRQPRGDRTEWSLHEIDPVEGGVLGSPLVLPTRAEHLTVATSTDKWYFIEKGPVRGPATQEVQSILTIEAEAISNVSARDRVRACD